MRLDRHQQDRLSKRSLSGWHHMFGNNVRTKKRGLFQAIQILMAVMMVLVLTRCAGKNTEAPFLVRVGDSGITVTQFKQEVEEAVDEAFPGETHVDKNAMKDLRMRILNQLTEEQLIVEKAKALGITLPKEDLDKAVEAVKADYPDNTFEETLLENAVSFSSWKQKMARRLLVQKVIQHELVDKVQITSQDVAAYYKTFYPQGPPEKENPDDFNQKVVRHLRQQKAEAAYKPWIEALRKEFTVDINQEQWHRLEGDS